MLFWPYFDWKIKSASSNFKYPSNPIYQICQTPVIDIFMSMSGGNFSVFLSQMFVEFPQQRRRNQKRSSVTQEVFGSNTLRGWLIPGCAVLRYERGSVSERTQAFNHMTAALFLCFSGVRPGPPVSWGDRYLQWWQVWGMREHYQWLSAVREPEA